jgi:hypothetical protein
MPAPPEVGLDLSQFGAKPLGLGVPFDPKQSLPRLAADMREAQEVEDLGLAQSASLTPLPRKTTKLDEPRLVSQAQEGPIRIFPRQLCYPLKSR